MEFKQYRLDNGIPVVAAHIPGIQTFTHMCAVRGGSRYETRQNNGLSHLLEHMMFKGTENRPNAEEIAFELETMGARNNAGTSDEVIDFYVRAQSKYFAEVADILSDQVACSLLSEDDIEVERNVVVQELRKRFSDAMTRAHDLFPSVAYGDQPAGLDPGGTEDIVLAATRQQLVELTKNHFTRDNLVVVLAGGLPRENTMLTILNDVYGRLQRTGRPEEAPVRPTGSPTEPHCLVSPVRQQQSALILGFECPGRHDDSKYALSVLSGLLAEGMSSRLFLEARERRGLTYGIQTHPDLQNDTGQFLTLTGTSPENVPELLTVVLGELKRTRREHASERELRKVKNMKEAGVAMMLESPQGLAQWATQTLIHYGHVKTFEEYVERLHAVTAEDVRRVAERVFRPEACNLIVAGPHEEAEADDFRELLFL